MNAKGEWGKAVDLGELKEALLAADKIASGNSILPSALRVNSR